MYSFNTSKNEEVPLILFNRRQPTFQEAMTKITSQINWSGWTSELNEKSQSVFTSPQGITYCPKTGEISTTSHQGKKKVLLFTIAAVAGIFACFSGWTGAFEKGGLPTALGSIISTYFLNLDGSIKFIEGNEGNETLPLIMFIAFCSAVPPAVLAFNGAGQVVPQRGFQLACAGGNLMVSTALNYTSLTSNFSEPFEKFKGFCTERSGCKKGLDYFFFFIMIICSVAATSARAHPMEQLCETMFHDPSDVSHGVSGALSILASIVGLAMFAGSLLALYMKIAALFLKMQEAIITILRSRAVKSSLCSDKISCVTALVTLYCAYYSYQNYVGLAANASSDFYRPWLSEDLLQLLYQICGVTGAANMLNRFGSIDKSMHNLAEWGSKKYNAYTEKNQFLALKKVAETFSENEFRTINQLTQALEREMNVATRAAML